MNYAILSLGGRVQHFLFSAPLIARFSLRKQRRYEALLQMILLFQNIASCKISANGPVLALTSGHRRGHRCNYHLKESGWMNISADTARRIMLQQSGLSSDLPSKWLPSLPGSRATRAVSETHKQWHCWVSSGGTSEVTPNISRGRKTVARQHLKGSGCKVCKQHEV